MSDDTKSFGNDGDEPGGESQGVTHILDEDFLNENADFSPAIVQTGDEGKDYSPASRTQSGEDPGAYSPVKADPGGIGELLLRENIEQGQPRLLGRGL